MCVYFETKKVGSLSEKILKQSKYVCCTIKYPIYGRYILNVE